MSRLHPFTIEEFKSIYSRVPRLCVDLIIKNEKGILLTKRMANGWLGQWHLPGGTVYLGESIENAIQRVSSEELGLSLHVTKLLGYIEYPSETKERGYGYSISLAFLCQSTSKNIQLDDQVSEYNFFSTLPDNLMAEQHHFLSKNFSDIL